MLSCSFRSCCFKTLNKSQQMHCCHLFVNCMKLSVDKLNITVRNALVKFSPSYFPLRISLCCYDALLSLWMKSIPLVISSFLFLVSYWHSITFSFFFSTCTLVLSISLYLDLSVCCFPSSLCLSSPSPHFIIINKPIQEETGMLA